MTTTIILSVLILVVIVCIFIIVNLLKKLEKIDDALIEVSLNLEEYIARVNQAYDKMKEVDSKELFKSDDETGYVFDTLKQVIEDINTNYPEERDDNNDKR